MFSRPSHSLHGKTVLITGAASGLGRRLAIDLHRERACRLIALDRDAAGLATLEEELSRDPRASSPSIQTHVLDVANAGDVRDLARRLDGQPIDALFTVAGVLYAGSFERMPEGAFERVIEVNLLGTVRVVRAFLPHLLRAPNPCVVNVASAAGIAGAPGMCAYSTSKFGVVGFGEAMAAELAGRVRVVTVCPTLVRTNLVKSSIPPARGRAATEPMDAILHRRGMPVERASRLILRGVERGKRVILFGWDAKLLDAARRFSPGLTALIVRVGYRSLLRRGVIPS